MWNNNPYYPGVAWPPVICAIHNSALPCKPCQEYHLAQMRANMERQKQLDEQKRRDAIELYGEELFDIIEETNRLVEKYL